ncbi:hypothetical protein RBH94_08165 [Aestuariibaculum sp. YM273]|uniref:hypothetical protein n=1 Tax=Aestuariibaculum sp. YM273 TaxID=3070659 RepID=UPI0027DE0ADA|nr:hypothetical protein [Aestuariibaculum sp. YM273]WMI64044.1 hypothetical protein RBH94_08165 [Aestuariibaculum sp. YM273]
MARTDFEKHIKEKLEDRKIHPSREAWNTLAERLDANEKKSNNKGYWWLGIAASFIGILFLVTLFIKTEDAEPVIVDNPKEIKQDDPVEVIAYEDDTLKIEEHHSNKTLQESVLKKQNEIIPKQEEPVIIAKEESVTPEDLQKVNRQLKKELSFEDQKVEEVVAKVNDLMTQNKNVTEDEIEALLIEAQRSINKEIIINQSTGIVDADLLLQDVETELDQSFRSKVFEAIKTSFGTVKTAVAQRNQ